MVDNNYAKFFGGRTRARLGARPDPSNVTSGAAVSALMRHDGTIDKLHRVRTRVAHGIVRRGCTRGRCVIFGIGFGHVCYCFFGSVPWCSCAQTGHDETTSSLRFLVFRKSYLW